MADHYECRQMRVLCLHSYRTNGAIFMQQLQAAGWYDAFPQINFVCLDGPYVCDAADGVGERDRCLSSVGVVASVLRGRAEILSLACLRVRSLARSCSSISATCALAESATRAP